MLISLLIFLLFPTLCVAEPIVYSESHMSYILTSIGAIITDWDNCLPDGEDAILNVPSVLGDTSVIGIGYGAFDTCNEGPDSRFRLVLPEGISYLEEGAFQCCNQATVISLPSTLVNIPAESFNHVTAEIEFPNGNPYFISENGFLIDTRTNTLLYTSRSSAHFPLPQVNHLASRCLVNWIEANSDNVEIRLPQSIESISSYVFYDFPDIESIILPSRINEIDSLAFYSCGLKAIVLPSSLDSVAPYCFVENYLDSVDISEGIQYIGEYAFYWNRGGLTEVTLPMSVKWVGYNAFPEECSIITLNPATHFETLEEYQIRDPDGEW